MKGKTGMPRGLVVGSVVVGGVGDAIVRDCTVALKFGGCMWAVVGCRQ